MTMTVVLLVILHQAILVFVVRGLGPVGLVWVGLGHGSTSSPRSGLGWVWVDEMDPWTTLCKPRPRSLSVQGL